MITVEEYFRKPHSLEQKLAADDLLDAVNALLDEAEAAGVYQATIDPDTGSQISGSSGGDGDGGFRTPGTRTGAPSSSHRQAMGVDVYDPGNRLDAWLDDAKLTEYGLYREHPDDTHGWCHLTTRAPASGRRTFKP